MSGYLIGADTANTFTGTTLAQGKGFAVGDRNTDASGNEYVFVKAGGTITANDTVHISSAYIANAITPALAVTAGFVGFAPVAFATDEYGWVMTRGAPTIRVGANCQSAVPLYTTDTAGVLDDLTVSASQYQVMGVLLVATNSGSASTGAATANFPMIRRPAA